MDAMEYSDYLYLEMELKCLRTFLKCSLGWSENLLLKCVDEEQLEDDNDDEVAVISLGSLLCKIKDALFILRREFGLISRPENTSSFVVADTDCCCFVLFDEIQKIISFFQLENLEDASTFSVTEEDLNIEALRQEINRAYITFSDSLSKSTSPMRDVKELMELIHTVLENITPVFSCCDGDVEVRFRMEAFHVRLRNLKVKLRSLKSFFCFAKFRVIEHSQLEKQLIHAEIFTLTAAHLLYAFWDHLKYETEDDDGTDGDSQMDQLKIDDMWSRFDENNEVLGQEINSAYTTFSDCLSKLTSPMRDVNELMELIDMALENLTAIFSCCDDDVEVRFRMEAFHVLLQNLKVKLRSLKSFFCFAKFRVVEHSQLENLLIHAEIFTFKAAHFLYMLWDHLMYEIAYKVFQDEADTLIKRDEMLQKIMFVDPNTPEIHIQALQALKASGSTGSLEMKNKEIARDFVDSLSDTLWILLTNSGSTSFLVAVTDQMQILYDGFLFLRTLLTNQLGNFDELPQEMKDFVGDLVNKAGTVVCLLCLNGVKDGFAKETNDAVCDFLEKIKLIKAEVRNKYPVTSTPNFPNTNQLGSIDFFLGNLKELKNCKLNSITLVEDQIQVFEKDLVFLRSFLHKFVDQHEELQSLQSCVMEVAYKAEFVIDSLMVGNIECSPLLFETIVEEMKHIMIQAMEINESTKYNMVEAQKFTKISSLVPSQGSNPTIDEDVLKLDGETTAIIDRLTRGSMQLDVITIVGMAGLGKTTLAKIVYNDPSIEYHFHIRSWCCVSQAYHKKDLLLQILNCTTAKHCNTNLKEMSEDDLDEQLYRHLKGKRYLIVLDDLWGTEAWNMLKNSFPDDANASRVLVTSRLQDLASEIKCNSIPHTLRLLTNDESWELLKMKLFVPPAMHVFGKEIATNCKGLPLTIIIVAGLLSTLEQDGWDEVLRSLSSESVSRTEQCRYTLELSYKHLPDYLKSCVLYFGLFPEDEFISTKRLVWLWIAEGFVQKTELKTLEEVAEDYMKDLIKRSLVMVEKRGSNGGVKVCKIHDVIHEFSVAKAREENFLQLLRGGNELFTFHEAGKVRRLSMYTEPKDFEEVRLFCPRVRSLFYFGLDYNLILYPSSFLYVSRIFRLLRVLDMYQIKLMGDVFPREIELLILLRFLSLPVTVNSIPPSIANLLYLETFLLRGFGGSGTIGLLPDTIWKMKNLRHLRLEPYWGFILPWSHNLENSCGLCHLQTISTVQIFCWENMEKITRLLPDIRKLKCRLSHYSSDISAGKCDRKSGGKCDRIFALDSLTRLESLRIHMWSVPDEFHITFPKNLKKLTLLSLHWQWSEISSIRKLPNLEVLKLKYESFEGEVWDMEEGEFPKLKYLELDNLDIVNWTGDSEHFPCLEKLVLNRLGELVEVPSCLSCILTLKMIKVWRCNKSIGDLVKKIEEEQKDYGNEGIKILIRDP